ncbi:MAG: DNA methyltransferase [Bacteroidetes bacterium]|nr:DNA methyltransferase [Bacteroidota bacterium]
MKLTGRMVADRAEMLGLYLYDHRIWTKNPTWQNSRWHSNSYRAVDEFEHIYIFWRPDVIQYDRAFRKNMNGQNEDLERFDTYVLYEKMDVMRQSSPKN